MTRWIDRLLIVALICVVAVLVATSLPSLGGDTLAGSTLMTHMLASGALVVGLPIAAMILLRHAVPGRRRSLTYRFGYIATLAAGLVTIATVFVCMLPVASTDQMHSLMSAHGWAGYLMVPAIALLAIGLRVTQSASHPRS